jgi:hypothetical protein
MFKIASIATSVSALGLAPAKQDAFCLELQGQFDDPKTPGQVDPCRFDVCFDAKSGAVTGTGKADKFGLFDIEHGASTEDGSISLTMDFHHDGIKVKASCDYNPERKACVGTWQDPDLDLGGDWHLDIPAPPKKAKK